MKIITAIVGSILLSATSCQNMEITEEKKLTKQQLAYFIKTNHNVNAVPNKPISIHEEIMNYQIDWREKAELSLLERNSEEFLKALSHINSVNLRTCLINAYNTLAQPPNKKSHIIVGYPYGQNKTSKNKKVHIIVGEHTYGGDKGSKIIYTQQLINKKKYKPTTE